MALTTSELWKTLLRTAGTRCEYQFDINGTIYGPEAETEHSVDNGLWEEFGIGNAACAKLTLSLLAEDIPRGATIKRHVRLVNGTEGSEWLSAGVFFCNHRAHEDGLWDIEAFDAMRKADKPWEPDQSLTFPLSMPEAVAEIARLMGVEVDPRTQFNVAYTIDYPASDRSSETGSNYTMRQVLQWIAAAHGGNFIMTPAGALRLVPVRKLEAPEETVLGTEDGDALDFGGFYLDASPAGGGDGENTLHEVGRDLTGAKNNGLARPISRVTLLVDDEHAVTAGDDTGMELAADCPYATQAMVDAILARLEGYQYQMFDATAVNLDPAAELGDLVVADGIRSVIARIDDDGSGYPDIAAPGEAEMEDEYPGEGPLTQAFNRKLAQVHSAIDKAADELHLYVENNVTQALAEVDISLDAILQRISDGEAKSAEIETKVDGIRLEVANEAGADGQVYARLTLKIGPNAYSGYIKLEGNVDVSGQLSADALYAALGDIADLTVNRLSTSRRIVKYLAGDETNDNYVRAQDQHIELVTGVKQDGTEQAVSPTGLPLYWEDDPEGADLGADGYPYRDGERIFTTTAVTPWPVTVFTYKDYVMRSMGFEGENGVYSVVDVFGTGDGAGGSQGRMQKTTGGLKLTYTTSAMSGKKELGLEATDEGYLDLYGLRKTVALDFSGWDGGRFTETVAGREEPYAYRVELDGQGRPVKITDEEGHEMAVTW